VARPGRIKGRTIQANPAAAVTRGSLEFVQLDALKGGDISIANMVSRTGHRDLR
jgi:hypothetical protein